MDSLTHLLVGHAMGTAASSAAQPYGSAVYWAVLIGNSLPDIDVPLSLALRRDIKLHRTITHTIPGATLLSLLTAVGLHLFMPAAPISLLFAFTFCGSLAHMLLDCLNLFGARLFWPFSARSIDLGILPIVDPYMLALLAIPTVGVRAGLLASRWLAYAFYLMGPYLLYRFVIARKLYVRLWTEGPMRVRIIPWFTGWRYLVQTESAIEFGRWIKGRRRAMATYPRHLPPLVQATRKNPQVAAFLKSAEYPYALVQEDETGAAIIWGDALRQLRADFRPVKVYISS